MNDPDREDGSDRPGLGREVGTALVEEAGRWLRWAAVGAVLGAAVLGGAGLWYFGTSGLGIGAAIGAVCGGLGAWLFYVHATTLG